MRRSRIAFAAAISTALLTSAAHAAAFTYRGTLQDHGRPADGAYDLELTLYSAQAGGTALAGPLALYAVPVREGRFSAAVDFGALSPDAAGASVSVRVRPAGQGEYVALDGRTPVAAALTGETASSVCPGAWTLNGNAGNVAGMYLGTSDAQPLLLKTGNLEAMTIGVEGGSTGNPGYTGRSVSLGDKNNLVVAGVVGGFVAGGGYGFSNTIEVGGDFATIGGGMSNYASNVGAAIAGGYGNEGRGVFSSVPGGRNNRAEAALSLAAGTYAVVRGSDDAGTADGDKGTFIWSDSTGGDAHEFTSSGPNQFDVKAGGGVGINRTPLNADVEVTITTTATGSNSTVDLALMPKDSAWGYDIAVNGTGQNDDGFGIFKTNGATFSSYLSINASGDLFIAGSHAYKAGALAWESPSDLRIKRDVAPIAGAIDTLLRLRPVSFHYADSFREAEGGLPDRTFLGFIAQEFAQVFPDAVSSTGKPLPGAPDAQPILALDPSPALITTVAAVRELAVRERDDHSDVAQLRSENAELRTRLDAVLARVQQLEHAAEH